MATNQNLSARVYTPQYKNMLTAVIDYTEAFKEIQVPVQSLDGIQHNEMAFSVKTNATPVVIGTYDDSANSGGFGDGTGASSRFGTMTEVIYGDEPVPYDYKLTIHEGIDNNTVNQDAKQAIADRLELQSQEQTRRKNMEMGKFLSKNATETKALESMKGDDVIKLFNEMSTLFTNREVNANLYAYVTPDVFNALVDLITFKALTGAKVDANNNKLVNWKGFIIQEVPAKYFADGDVAYFAAEKIVLPFIGIEVARTVESTNFNGVQLQAYAKGGHYVSDDNKQAIAKVTMNKTVKAKA
ncbi:hypothetical protein WS105_0617 [Weissella ceti]|uniref:hypothetical protein n=1 Tax=Weissella ceti TaxID=759620 RepID=UPI0004F90151|nr:hypothetical protein [Weissella ceti]AIM64207.1 hypothetical protein WS105_0617 [Weissella ceti]